MRRNLFTILTGVVLQKPQVTTAAPATPTRNRLYSDSIVKGWVETSGGGAWTIDDSLNVSSITDNATGDFTINWALAWANGNYAIMGAAIGSTAVNFSFREATTTAKSTTVVRCGLADGSNTAIDPATGINVIAVGDQ